MKNLINRLKNNEIFRKAVQKMTFGLTVFAPNLVFAASASPESKYQAVLSGISNLLLGLAIPAAILASIVYALMYKFAGTAHKKADIIDSIKGTAGILIFVLTAGLIMNWIASMVQ